MTTSASPWPTLVPWPSAHALTFQPVRFSGMVRDTSANPCLSVVSEAVQKAVSAKFLRTAGSTPGGGAGGAGPFPGPDPSPVPGLSIQ